MTATPPPDHKQPYPDTCDSGIVYCEDYWVQNPNNGVWVLMRTDCWCAGS